MNISWVSSVLLLYNTFDGWMLEFSEFTDAKMDFI